MALQLGTYKINDTNFVHINPSSFQATFFDLVTPAQTEAFTKFAGSDIPTLSQSQFGELAQYNTANATLQPGVGTPTMMAGSTSIYDRFGDFIATKENVPQNGFRPGPGSGGSRRVLEIFLGRDADSRMPGVTMITAERIRSLDDATLQKISTEMLNGAYSPQLMRDRADQAAYSLQVGLERNQAWEAMEKITRTPEAFDQNTVTQYQQFLANPTTFSLNPRNVSGSHLTTGGVFPASGYHDSRVTPAAETQTRAREKGTVNMASMPQTPQTPQARVQMNANGLYDLISPSGSIMAQFRTTQEAQTFGQSNYQYTFTSPSSTTSPQGAPASSGTASGRWNVLSSGGGILAQFGSQQEADAFQKMNSGGTTVSQSSSAPGSIGTTPKSESPSPTTIIDEGAKRSEAGRIIITSSGLPQQVQQMLLDAYDHYQGVDVNPNEVIAAFNRAKNNTIDPYYRGQINLAIADFNNQQNVLSRTRSLEMEQEQATADQNIRITQENLEKKGLLTSGESVRQLGAISPYKQGTGTTDGTIPFGGALGEGSVPQSNRLVSSGTQSRYRNNLALIGQNMETKLGSGAVGGVGGYTPVGGVEGAFETSKQKDYGSTLNSLLDNYYARQNLTDIKIPQNLK